jgi:hypothetical protein
MAMALRILEQKFRQWLQCNCLDSSKISANTHISDVGNKSFFEKWIAHDQYFGFGLPIPRIEIFSDFKVKYKQHSILSRFLTWMLTEVPEYLNINLGSSAQVARFLNFVQKDDADNWVRKGNLFVDFSIPHGKYSHLLQFTLIMISLNQGRGVFKSFRNLPELLKKLIDQEVDGDSLWVRTLDSYDKKYNKGPGVINAMFLSNWALACCPTFVGAYRTHYVKKLITYLDNEKILKTGDNVEEVLRYFVGLGSTFYVENDHQNFQKNIREKFSDDHGQSIYLLNSPYKRL